MRGAEDRCVEGGESLKVPADWMDGSGARGTQLERRARETDGEDRWWESLMLTVLNSINVVEQVRDVSSNLLVCFELSGMLTAASRRVFWSPLVSTVSDAHMQLTLTRCLIVAPLCRISHLCSSVRLLKTSKCSCKAESFYFFRFSTQEACDCKGRLLLFLLSVFLFKNSLVFGTCTNRFFFFPFFFFFFFPFVGWICPASFWWCFFSKIALFLDPA